MSKVRSITPNNPANFTPEMGNYKTLQPFRYWCQKVLPLVYDDSLSYYELLCKVVDYLNKTMEDVETLHGDVTNLHTAYDELQSYVNNYFSTLDVQEEINNKLDNMASSGELYAIIRKYTDPIVDEQNSKITVLENRMNTFASLPEGSTSGDAELIDIRVPASGFNGDVAYTSAGDAVREQVGEIANKKGMLKLISGNLVKGAENWTWGGYISSENVINAPGMMYSDNIPIDIDMYKKIAITGYDNNSIPIAIFSDRNENYLGKIYPNNATVLSGSYPGFVLDMSKLSYMDRIANVRFNTAQTYTNNYIAVYGDIYPSKYIQYIEPYYTIKSEDLMRVLDSLYKIANVKIDNVIEPKSGYYTQKIAIGKFANPEDKSGNIAIGLNALQNNNTNIAVENDDSGLWNTAVGHRAMEKNQNGNHSSAFGFQALRNMVNGIHNTAVGENAMHGQTDGNQNVAVGSRALQSVTSGNNNTAIGHASAYWNDSQHPTGNNNTYIGCHSGQADGSGSDNVAIGYFSGSTNNMSNTISIGTNTSATKDNEIVIGNKEHTSLKIAGKVINFNEDGTVTWE